MKIKLPPHVMLNLFQHLAHPVNNAAFNCPGNMAIAFTEAKVFAEKAGGRKS